MFSLTKNFYFFYLHNYVGGKFYQICIDITNITYVIYVNYVIGGLLFGKAE